MQEMSATVCPRSISVVTVFDPVALAKERISFVQFKQDFFFPRDLYILWRLVFQRFEVFVFDVPIGTSC
jgi:hypothetical protein